MCSHPRQAAPLPPPVWLKFAPAALPTYHPLLLHQSTKASYLYDISVLKIASLIINYLLFHFFCHITHIIAVLCVQLYCLPGWGRGGMLGAGCCAALPMLFNHCLLLASSLHACQPASQQPDSTCRFVSICCMYVRVTCAYKPRESLRARAGHVPSLHSAIGIG